MKPFHNMWPKYNNVNEFMTDYEFNCFVAAEAIPAVIQYINSN